MVTYQATSELRSKVWALARTGRRGCDGLTSSEAPLHALSLAAALLLARDRCVCLQLPLECEPAKPQYPRRTHNELSFNILFAHTGDFSSDLFCGGFLRVVLGGIFFEGGIGYRTTTPGASFCFLGRYLLVFFWSCLHVTLPDS